MRSLCAALLALGLVFSRVSTAREFELDIAGNTGYDSNVFRKPTGPMEVSDLTYYLAPRMRFRDTELPLTYDLLYSPTFVGYIEQTDANEWNHRARLQVDRYFSERTKLSVSDAFARYSGYLLDNLEAGGGAELDVGRVPRSVNDLELSLLHVLTQRVRAYATLGYDITRYEAETLADWDYLSAALSFTSAMSSRDTVGLGASVSYRSFDDIELREPDRTSSLTRYYYTYLYLQHSFSEEFAVTLQGGPSWIDVRRWGSPGLPPNSSQPRQSETDFTWFGEARIAKRWGEVTTSATYNRNETALGGSDRSAIRDAVTLRASWEPEGPWSMRTSGGWSRRVSKDPRTDGTDRDSVWDFAIVVARKLTHRSSLELAWEYHKQESIFGSGASRFDRYSGLLGFRYDLSPVRF